MTLAEINIEVDVGRAAAPPADPADRLVRGPDARRAPDLVPHLRHRVPRLDHRRRDRRRVRRARDPTSAELAVRVVVFSVLATMAVAIALDFMARPGREGPVRAARPPAAGPAPGQAGASARSRRRCASARCSASRVATGCCTGGSRRPPASPTRSSGPACAPRSRTAAACSSSSARSRRPAATCCPRPVIAELTQLQSAVAARRSRRDPRGRGGGARPAGRRGVRHLRLDSARRRVDRPGPPRDAGRRARSSW